jgi:hypothetical protein
VRTSTIHQRYSIENQAAAIAAYAARYNLNIVRTYRDADEDGPKMRIYLTKACRACPFKDQCTTSNEHCIKRWEHEHVVEAAQTRLDKNPQAMRVRRETVEHPFATLKMRMGATHSALIRTTPPHGRPSEW